MPLSRPVSSADLRIDHGSLPPAPSPGGRHADAASGRVALKIGLERQCYVAGQQIRGVLEVHSKTRGLALGDIGIEFGGTEGQSPLSMTRQTVCIRLDRLKGRAKPSPPFAGNESRSRLDRQSTSPWMNAYETAQPLEGPQDTLLLCRVLCPICMCWFRRPGRVGTVDQSCWIPSRFEATRTSTLCEHSEPPRSLLTSPEYTQNFAPATIHRRGASSIRASTSKATVCPLRTRSSPTRDRSRRASTRHCLAGHASPSCSTSPPKYPRLAHSVRARQSVTS